MKTQKEQPATETGIIRTEAGIDVTERVKDGRTVFSHDKEIAQIYADQKRSYVYPAYDAKRNFIGYCVPK